MTFARSCSVIPNVSLTTRYDRSIRQRSPLRLFIKEPGLMPVILAYETV